MSSGSVSSRVIAAGLLVIVVVVAALAAGVYVARRTQLTNDLRQVLDERASIVRDLVTHEEPEELAALLSRAGVRATIELPDGRLQFARPAVTSTVVPAPASLSPADVTSRAVELPNGTVVTVEASRQGVQRALRQLLISELIGLFCVVALGWYLLRRACAVALRPLDDVVALARTVTTGDSGARLRPSRTDTEIGYLAAVIDGMLDSQEAAILHARGSDELSQRFLADAAHQLRTPLAAAQGLSEALINAPTEGDRQRLLAKLLRELGRAGQMITRMLTLARLDSGEAPTPVPMDLAELTADEVERAAELAPEKRITLHETENVRGRVVADPECIREAMSNLLDNARRHAATSIDVYVQVLRSAVEVTVDDDGPGLPPSQLERAFQRFVSLGDNRGSGLGLAIARDVARAYGGDVTYSHGSFKLILPIAGSTTESVAEPA